MVTGSSGFIGTHVANALLGQKYVVVGLDIKPPETVPAGLCFEQSDILDAQRLLDIIRDKKPNAIIHLAARTDLDETKDIRGYSANIDGVRNLVRAVRSVPGIRRCIYTSSQLVCRIGHVPVTDTDYCPDTLYGRSKVQTEEIVREEDGGGVEWCLTRPTAVWGPYMGAHYQNMLRLVRKGRYFHCGKGELYKSYAYVGNVAHQYARLLTADAAAMHRKTFYLADYEPLSLRYYTDGLARAMGAPGIPTVPVLLARFLATAGDVLNTCGFRNFPFNSFRLNNILTEYVYDLSSTEAVCGPGPYTKEQGIEETARWFLKKTL